MSDVFSAAAIALQTPGLNGQNGLPVLLWGSPGAAKTSKINQIIKKLGWHMETVIAGLREPSDFAGLPTRRPDGSVDFAPPAWGLRLAASAGPSVGFLDEVSTAAPATQKALLRALLEGVLGDLALPKGKVRWIAAANPADQAADGFELAPPVANRLIHLDVPDLEADTWAIALAGGFAGEEINVPIVNLALFEETFRTARALGGGFIRRHPALLNGFPKEEETRGKAWPSPRSWEIGLRAWAGGKAAGDEVAAGLLLCGAIGTGAGSQFLAWVSEQDLPDPREVLKNPTAWVPEKQRADRSMVTLSACAQEAIEGKVKDATERKVLIEAAWTLIGQCLSKGMPDLGLPAAIQLSKHRQKGPVESATLVKLLPLLKESGILN